MSLFTLYLLRRDQRIEHELQVRFGRAPG
jgi:hypothetical protein